MSRVREGIKMVIKHVIFGSWLVLSIKYRTRLQEINTGAKEAIDIGQDRKIDRVVE